MTRLPGWGWLLVAGGLVAVGLAGFGAGNLLRHEPAQAHDAVAQAPASTGTQDTGMPAGWSPVQWRAVTSPVGSTHIPVSAAGPTISARGQWSGWAQTEQGAVQAGWTGLYGCAVLENAEAAQCTRTHYSGAWTEEIARWFLARPPGEYTEVGPVGFDVRNYTDHTATVVYRESVETMIINLAWDDGQQDWRIVASSNETRPRNAHQVAPGEQYDFISWGPAHG